jgi:hypothetical protein
MATEQYYLSFAAFNSIKDYQIKKGINLFMRDDLSIPSRIITVVESFPPLNPNSHFQFHQGLSQ